MPKTVALEDVIQDLEEIVAKMEKQDTPVEECIKLYDKAEKLAEKAIAMLEAHQGSVMVISDKVRMLEEKFNA